MSDPVYVVAADRPWQTEAFEHYSPKLPGKWVLVERATALDEKMLSQLKPEKVFFPHWSSRIPPDVFNSWECVLFHMTDLPYGRGGSPLQNLIVRGHKETVLSAIRVVEALDAGPVYLKRPLSLEGAARDIFKRAADLTWEMIGEILMTEPTPQPQSGEAVVFSRRKPEESLIPTAGDLVDIYNHIRMLDADGYPKAFLNFGAFRIEFDAARIERRQVSARVSIRKMQDDDELQ